MKFVKIICLSFLIYTNPSFGTLSNHPDILIIPPQLALPIGIKIWFNESNGDVMGLTTWNKEENFASLGIGHFLWHPKSSKRASKNSGFPGLLNYMKIRNEKIPAWLQEKKGLYCPWNTRKEFIEAKNSLKMKELRNFLQRTIPIQAEYMGRQLQDILPDLLASTPTNQRTSIKEKFNTLASTPGGIYALMDYLNFKGAGLGDKSLENYEHGTGLLQVLKGMGKAPKHSTPIQSFVWSAKHALVKRVERKPQRERWLAGWFSRLNTYLEADFMHKAKVAKPQLASKK